MQKTLDNRQDIVLLIDTFYKTAMADMQIGHFFSEVIPLSLEEHLPIICDFWDSVLFGTGTYNGNPVLKHILLHQKSPLELDHFKQWLHLFNQSVDAHFIGDKANEIKQKAATMGQLMRYKIAQSEGKHFIQ